MTNTSTSAHEHRGSNCGANPTTRERTPPIEVGNRQTVSSSSPVGFSTGLDDVANAARHVGALLAAAPG